LPLIAILLSLSLPYSYIYFCYDISLLCYIAHPASAAADEMSSTPVENRRSLRRKLPQTKVLELKNNQLTSEIQKRLENPNEGLEVCVLIEINCTYS
jgi:hypothetical protein